MRDDESWTCYDCGEEIEPDAPRYYVEDGDFRICKRCWLRLEMEKFPRDEKGRWKKG